MSTVEDRFMGKIDKLTSKKGCWLWTAATFPNGYGRFWVEDKMLYAHRASYELFVELIPKGLNVLHECDVASCVNPDHLFLGTQSDNAIDFFSKGLTRGNGKLISRDVVEIRRLYKNGFIQKEIAQRFNVWQGNISSIVTGKSWAYVK